MSEQNVTIPAGVWKQTLIKVDIIKAEFERLKDEITANKHMKAENERLDSLCKELMNQHSDISCENIILRKIGDKMNSMLGLPVNETQQKAINEEWNKAKGVQS